MSHSVSESTQIVIENVINVASFELCKQMLKNIRAQDAMPRVRWQANHAPTFRIHSKAGMYCFVEYGVALYSTFRRYKFNLASKRWSNDKPIKISPHGSDSWTDLDGFRAGFAFVKRSIGFSRFHFIRYSTRRSDSWVDWPWVTEQ